MIKKIETEVNKPQVTLCNPMRTPLPKPALGSDRAYFTEVCSLRAENALLGAVHASPKSQPGEPGQQGAIIGPQ